MADNLTAFWNGQLLTQPISEWGNRVSISPEAIRNRYLKRAAGMNSYTDEQVIFGAKPDIRCGIADEAWKDFCFKRAKTKPNYKAAVPFGIWDLCSGMWIPDDLLASDIEQQHAHNVKHGFSCQCGYLPSRCKCGGKSKHENAGSCDGSE